MNRDEDRNEGKQAFAPSTEESFFVRSPRKAAVVIAAAMMLVGFLWVHWINDAQDRQRSESIRYLTNMDRERRMSQLEAENKRLRTAAHPDYDPDRENEQLLMPFDGMNPCGLADYGTASAVSWPDHPERGLGCSYTRDGETTLIVTIGAGPNDGSITAMNHDGVAGYFTVSNAGKRTLYFWAPGTEDEAMHSPGTALMSLRPL